MAGTSSQRQGPSVEPRHRKRAEHHARYKLILFQLHLCLSWVFPMFWQIDYTQNTSLRRRREAVAMTVQSTDFFSSVTGCDRR